MLSSVSYVCSGMCAGMWVISAYIFGGTRSSFISAFKSFFLVLDFLLCVCVFFVLLFCRCF